MGLSNTAQAVLMFFAILIGTYTPTLYAWLNAGAQTTTIALAGLVFALIGELGASIVVFLKEYAGITITTTQTGTTITSTAT